MIKLYKKNLNFLKHIDKSLYNKTLQYNTKINIDHNKIPYYINTIYNYNDILYNSNNISSKRTFNDGGEFLFSNFKISQDLSEFKKILNFPILDNSIKLKEIPNFIFFGLLYKDDFINLTQKTDTKRYLVVESDFYKFIVSLYTIDYGVLFKNRSVSFCIANNQADILSKMQQFIKQDYLDNYVYQYSISQYTTSEVLALFKLALQNSAYDSYDHYRQLTYIKRTSKTLNRYKILQYDIQQSSISDKPIFILSPGPSLRENLSWIQKYQDKFFIVSYGATLHILEEFDIVPDIIVIMDAAQVVKKQFPKDKKYLKKIKQSIAFLACDADKNIFKFFKKKNIFIFESIFTFSTNAIPQSSAFTVGDMSLHILLSLGFKEIYLVGTDLCLDSVTKSGYDRSHISSEANCIDNNLKKITKKVDDETISVKANLSDDEVETIQLFFRILQSYKSVIEYHKNNFNFNIYNLSNGAYIEGTIPKIIKKINLPNTIEQKKQLVFKLLNTKSIDNFSKNKQNIINKEIVILERSCNILDDFNTLKVSSYNQIYNFIKSFIDTIIQNRFTTNRTTILLLTYINITIRYLNIYFNNKDIKENIEILNQLKFLIYKQLYKLIKQYIKYLKQLG